MSYGWLFETQDEEVSGDILCVRRRSGHDKVAAVGAYLRVSGPSGPLTGVY